MTRIRDPIPALSWGVYFLRYGWVRFKAAFGLPIDVDKNFYAADAAWRLVHGLLPRGVKITVAGRSDGAGMQTVSRISGLNFAAAFGATYVHTPFFFVEHGRDGEALAQAWDAFLNLGEGEIGINDEPFEIVDYPDYFFGRAKLTSATVLRFQQCYWPGKQAPATYYNIVPRLREKLRFEPTTPQSRPLQVAIHVRRGDVSASANNSRFTDTSRVLKSVRQVAHVLNDLNLPYRMCIHSQGDSKEFAEFQELGCELSLDADALWTMRRLIEADVLVMSKSSFSFTAALSNAGVKLCEPWLHTPLPDWIVRRPDGGFDERRFRERLDAFLQHDRAARAAQPSEWRETAESLALEEGRPV
jgi:hypothetical protein